MRGILNLFYCSLAEFFKKFSEINLKFPKKLLNLNFYVSNHKNISINKLQFGVVTWYMGSGLKAQNMTGIRAQRKGLRDQKNGIREHKAFQPESGFRFITRSKNLLSHYFSA